MKYAIDNSQNVYTRKPRKGDAVLFAPSQPV